MHPRDFEHQQHITPATPLGDNELSVKWFGTAAYRLEYRGRIIRKSVDRRRRYRQM